jgi:hypothetical protein
LTKNTLGHLLIHMPEVHLLMNKGATLDIEDDAAVLTFCTQLIADFEKDFRAALSIMKQEYDQTGAMNISNANRTLEKLHAFARRKGILPQVLEHARAVRTTYKEPYDRVQKSFLERHRDGIASAHVFTLIERFRDVHCISLCHSSGILAQNLDSDAARALPTSQTPSQDEGSDDEIHISF